MQHSCPCGVFSQNQWELKWGLQTLASGGRPELAAAEPLLRNVKTASRCPMLGAGGVGTTGLCTALAGHTGPTVVRPSPDSSVVDNHGVNCEARAGCRCQHESLPAHCWWRELICPTPAIRGHRKCILLLGHLERPLCQDRRPGRPRPGHRGHSSLRPWSPAESGEDTHRAETRVPAAEGPASGPAVLPCTQGVLSPSWSHQHLVYLGKGHSRKGRPHPFQSLCCNRPPPAEGPHMLRAPHLC